MSDTILVINAGSSSIKYSVFLAQGGALALHLRGQIESIHTQAHFEVRDGRGEPVADRHWPTGATLGHEGAMSFLEEFLREYLNRHRLVAVGHRVVHGGQQYLKPIRVTHDDVQDLEAFVPLAPLHQPHNLWPIRHLLSRAPEVPQIACFDTSFHCTAPPERQAYPLPERIARQGVRRYGFHGLSYEYIASVLPLYDRRAAQGRTIVLHLGNGASVCGMSAGRSVGSSMGFTALGGLPMGTRCGDLDPGVLLFLMQQMQMDPASIENLLYRESGLLGASGLSSDMRTLLASQDPKAAFAVKLFVDAVARQIGAMAASLGGVDALVFTAGIGEHAAPVREQVCRGAEWLGVELDTQANSLHGPRISTAGSRVSAWVIPTDEELMIARHTLALVDPGKGERR